MRNRIRLLVIALLAVLSLAACGNEGSGTATVNMKQLQQAMLAAAPSLSETASTTGDAADAARVEKAQVFTKDQYAVLIICDDSPTVKTAFDDFLPSSDTGSD